MDDKPNQEAEPQDEAPDYDTPVLLDKDGNPAPKAQEKRQPRRGSDPTTPKLVAARVQRIALLMASGQWGYASAFALADEWELKLSTVRCYAVQAGNLLDLLVDTDEALRTRMCATLDTIVMRAMEKERFREAIEAIKTLAGLKGLDKAHEALKENTRAVVGLSDLIGPHIRAAVAANEGEPAATATESDPGHGSGG